ncbi:MAG: DUF502 domain-containing protein, partial [Phycisphaerae bacterium]
EALKAFDEKWAEEAWAKIPGSGALLILLTVYLTGLLARLWGLRWVFATVERIMSRLPGIKTIYQSVRDILKLFGGEAERMGKAVLYTPPGAGVSLLGIMTNESPSGVADRQPDKVAIYLPYSYMIGGPTIYVPREHVEIMDMTPEEAMKLSATAHVGAQALLQEIQPRN